MHACMYVYICMHMYITRQITNFQVRIVLKPFVVHISFGQLECWGLSVSAALTFRSLGSRHCRCRCFLGFSVAYWLSFLVSELLGPESTYLIPGSLNILAFVFCIMCVGCDLGALHALDPKLSKAATWLTCSRTADFLTRLGRWRLYISSATQ